MRRWVRSLGRRVGWPDPAGDLTARRAELVRRIEAPTVWMFGKTGSGKSSLVGLMTGADQIEIGAGFRPTTRQTNLYTFPDASLPVMHFLDTRGLGEPGYDAADDMAELKVQADAMIVTQRVSDFATESVLESLGTIRRSAPQRPVLLALTCLHETYPRQPHPPYPFGESRTAPSAPEGLQRAVLAQREAFGGLVDAIVPVDITQPGDGLPPVDYGAAHFLATLTEMLPAAYQHVLRGMAQLQGELQDLHEQKALIYIHSAALTAAVAALAPVPWVDIPAVAAVQTQMVYALARVYQQSGSVKKTLEMLTAAGLGFAARLGVRELLKLVPFVGTIAGGVVGATLAYSHTYAVGRVCMWYYGRIREGNEPTRDEIREVFQSNWNEGKEIWTTIRQNRAAQ